LNLQPTDVANLATSIALIATSIVLIVLVARMGAPKQEILRKAVRVTKIATLLLGVFLLVHGFYHVAEYFGNDFVSDDLLEPASIMLLFAFTIYVKTYIFVPKTPSLGVASAPKIKGASPKVRNRSLIIVPTGVFLAVTLLSDFAGNIPETFSLLGITVSVALFAWMTIKNPSPQSLHFEFAIIVIIWAAAEIPHGLNTLGILSLGNFDVYGTWIHFLSMLLIGIFICLRIFRLALLTKKGQIDPVLLN
jgi:hypothetical protein